MLVAEKLVPVWPGPEDTVQGGAIEPIHGGVPKAVDDLCADITGTNGRPPPSAH